MGAGLGLAVLVSLVAGLSPGTPASSPALLADPSTPTIAEGASLQELAAASRLPDTAVAGDGGGAAAEDSVGDAVAVDDFSAQGPPQRADRGGQYRAAASPGVQLTSGGDQLAVEGLGAGRSYDLALPDVAQLDVGASHVVQLSDGAEVGGTVYERTEVRRQPDASAYQAVAVVRADGRTVLRLSRKDQASVTVLARSSQVIQLTPADRLVVEVRVTGTSPVTVSGRAYVSGTEAPPWQVSVLDASPAAITTPGSVAVGAYVSRAAKAAASLRVSSLLVHRLVTPDSGPGAEPTSSAPASSPGEASTPGGGPTTSEPTRSTTAPDPVPSPSASEPSPPSSPPSSPSSASTGASASQAPAPTPAAPSSAAPTPDVDESTAPAAPATTAAASSRAEGPLVPSTSAAGFSHPGVVNGAEQLAQVRARIAAGEEPWTGALAKAQASRFASLGWRPNPVPVVGCGKNHLDEGCTLETDDAQAAYTQALLYSLTGDRRRADKAIEILDAWAQAAPVHPFDKQLYVNGKVQSAWAAVTFTKAAELVRHSDAGWPSADSARFGEVLRTSYLPMVRGGWYGGGANWQMSMAEATMAIGVYLDDRTVFDDGVQLWRSQVVSHWYLSTDGSQPTPPAGTYVTPAVISTYWWGATRFVDGMGQETCRDLGHATMGLSAALSGAQTASLQGVDLFGQEQRRLVAAMELTAQTFAAPGSGAVCPRPATVGRGAEILTLEIGYAHYAREGLSLPHTRRWLDRTAPTGTSLFLNWETLSHAVR